MKPMVGIKVTGFNLDQLLNKIITKGILIYNIKREQANVMFFNVDYKALKIVKPLVKNYEYHITYWGLANFKIWLKKSLACILTLPIIFCLMSFSTRFTWDIKIYGANELNNQVVDILKANDIKVGGFLPGDSKQIEQILLKQLPNVAQVSCITRGTTIVINISKKLVYTPENYQPICANLSGIITSFSLISGTMAVNVGDFVSVGDVLVYPFTIDKSGNKVDVKPIAEIRAKAYVTGSSKLSASQTQLIQTGNKYTTSSITFLNKNLFSKKVSKPFALYTTCVYNENISSVLPIVKTVTTYYELAEVVVNYDLVAECGRIERESVDNAYQNLPSNIDILDETTTSLIVNDTLYANTTLTISTIISL